MSPASTTPRTVLVTGASAGIGRGIALACAELGWEVWIAARRGPEAAAVADEVTAAGGHGRSVVCDVSAPAPWPAYSGPATSGRGPGITRCDRARCSRCEDAIAGGPVDT